MTAARLKEIEDKALAMGLSRNGMMGREFWELVDHARETINRGLIDELRKMKYTDTADFRALCEDYAAKNNLTVEAATAILKPICDSRERPL